MNEDLSADLGPLVAAAASVAEAGELSDVLARTVETAMKLTGAPYGALGVLGAHGVVREFIHRGVDATTAASIGHPPEGKGVLGAITREPGALRLEDLAHHPDSVGFPPHHPVMTTFLGAPIRVGEHVFGNLYLTNKEGGFDERDEAMVLALAAVAGSAITTARLQQRLRRIAVAEDRERIARDLHDEVIQDLFAVGLSLQALAQRVADGSVGQELKQAAVRLDDGITSLREYIFDLHPPVWAVPGLDRELEVLLDRFRNANGPVLTVELDGPAYEVSLPVREEVLAIVKEAVSNAVRHGFPQTINVTISMDDQWLVAQIVDDGRGFDPYAVSSGLGLENLRERSRRLGGSAAIVSSAGAGTTVRVALPLV